MQRKSKQTTFEQPIPLVMSPLADPVVGAIFSSMEQAGLAAESLVGSILREEGYTLGQITNVVPQRYYKAYPDMRGCRVDIFVDTLEGKKAIVEVQLAAEPILIRNLFEVSQMIAAAIPLGTDVKELKDHMPHIIVINILNFDLRKDHQDYIQPVGFLYTKSPHTIAEDHIRIFNVQLPRFREQTHDLKKPLDAWLYLLDTAHQKKVSLKEVIAMEPILQETIDLDAGLKQFTEGYDKAAADPEVQEEYRKYYSEILRMEGMLYAAKANGKAEGKLEGKLEGQLQLIKNLMKTSSMSAEQAMEALLIPPSDMLTYINLLND